ncbi:MAG: hypothetical protein D8M57_16115 [Candidatus Scalindua sp. AMX11]|nr:MAG: hypothetical protein DWQ00_03590 [Candidatus Scalindua sp.]NOG82799.1 hypothetical protein [Planctomycetota bacterium]RZV69027.1 MAG: hypothetical protein EX341_16280 [Candidatus Scalindua sp. SCAELEC01]TDE63858.1 MAG: hypothetical protein D8M57_16115 [Candidatus Scalindua sp. AMX11]GJQ60428.1 MAG: hypothetical protein SCALA701_32290 [Candidatus Scalindua sp.]
MFTKEQFDEFKYVYEKEDARFSELINRGKIYLSIITVYIGVFTLKIQDIATLVGNEWYSKVILGATGACFIFALLACVLALGIFKYEGLCNIKTELLKFDDAGKPNAEFYEDRLADMAVAYERNSLQNDRRALLLQLSSYLIFTGLFCHIIVFYSYIWRANS